MRFEGLGIFHDATAVDRLALQIQMVGNDDDNKPTNQPPKVADCPPKILADAIEAELKAGRATTCSEALRNIAASKPHLIDRASDFKTAVETDKLTAEAKYFAAVREIQLSSPGISRTEAQQLCNRKYPSLREAFAEEVNARQTPLTNKPLNAGRLYWNKVSDVMREKSCSRSEAMQVVNRLHPDLRGDMVKELNSI